MDFKDKFINLVYALLNDAEGISEDAYDCLLELGDELLPDNPEWNSLKRMVDATDGRFYIPAGDD